MARGILDRKAAVDVSLVVDAFLACFIPLWIVGVCRQIMKVVPILSVKITNAIFFVSFMANPIIYSDRKQAFQESVKNMMRRIRFRCGSNSSNGNEIVANQPRCLTRPNGETSAISITSRPDVSTGSSALNGKTVDVNLSSRALEISTPSGGPHRITMDISPASRTVHISTPSRPGGNTDTSSFPEPLVLTSSQELRISSPLPGPIETLSVSASFQEPLTPGMHPVSVRSPSTLESLANPVGRPSPSRYLPDQARIPSTKAYHPGSISQRSSGISYECTPCPSM